MRNKFTLSTIALALLFITACKKSSDKGPIDGNWNFTSMHVTGTSTSQDTENGTVYKTVSTSDYTTKDNKGTVAISGGSMSSKGLAYSVDTTFAYVSYEDDVETDEGTLPFFFTLPESSSVSSFKLIGTDSIYFPSGGFGSIGGTTTQSAASGGRYTLSDNKLTITLKVDQTSTDNSSGIAVQKHDVATATTTLTRQ